MRFILRYQIVTPNVLRSDLILRFMLRYLSDIPNVLRCEQKIDIYAEISNRDAKCAEMRTEDRHLC